MEKYALVTGGTKGIGLAIIHSFAKNNFSLITCSRNQADLARVKNEVEGQYKVNVYTYQADLSVRSEAKDFCSFVNQLQVPIHVLINNSGTFVPGQLMTEPEGTLEKMIEANVYSAYTVTRAIVPGMISRGEGHIFNMCSIASLQAYPNGGAYSISKFALLGFSKCLRQELAELGIRVTSVMPGATLTDSWKGTGLPDERFMSAEDIAAIIYDTFSLSKRTVVEEIVIRPQLGDL